MARLQLQTSHKDLNNSLEIDTDILDGDQQLKLIEMFKKQKIIDFKNENPHNRATKRFKSLYRGSEDGFKSDSFYTKCGGQKNVFCIIESEENNIFGGYSEKGWKTLKPNEDKIKYNQDSNAFLFCFKSASINDDFESDEKEDNDSRLEIFGLRSDSESKYSMVSIQESMCGFGENGQDICISNLCNSNNESWISFDEYGSTFNTPSHSYLNDGFNWFQVKHIEIFQIVY
mmetsp:Transcript_4275/g.3740  ORF Transcript_4275/g.3740 Transcript_4275/m.3740 type:complete len:230 (+) Transcript_4275:1554-2243(+)